MEWTRSETIGMASASCVFCRGLGLRKTAKLGELKPCNCVFRAIFKACLDRYRVCVQTTGRLRTSMMEYMGGPTGWKLYGRKYEEYVADFDIISRRTLNEVERMVLREFLIERRGWRHCAQKTGLDRGTFFHTIYAVQEKLGRAFRETEPYALFPLDEYFTHPELRKVAVIRVPGAGSERDGGARTAKLIPFPVRRVRPEDKAA